MDDVKNKDLDQQRIFQPSGKEPRGKLNCYDWLADVPGEKNVFDMVEVQFKNTRKGYYRNSMNLPLEIGDMVAVEASPGHDIGRGQACGFADKESQFAPRYRDTPGVSQGKSLRFGKV